MIKPLSILLIILSFSINANAQLATFDATQATNMIKQIESTAELISNAESQLTKLESLDGNITGNLGRASGLNTKLNEIKRKYSRLTRSIERINLGNGLSPDFSKVGDIQQTLDHIYDPASYNRPEKRRLQRIHRQSSKKSALEEAEYTINNIGSNLEDIDKLISEVDETQSLKDSQDMTNKLLVTLITNQIEVKNLLAQLTRAEAVEDYEGVATGEEYRAAPYDLPDNMIEGATSNWGDDNIPCPDVLADQNKC